MFTCFLWMRGPYVPSFYSIRIFNFFGSNSPHNRIYLIHKGIAENMTQAFIWGHFRPHRRQHFLLRGINLHPSWLPPRNSNMHFVLDLKRWRDTKNILFFSGNLPAFRVYVSDFKDRSLELLEVWSYWSKHKINWLSPMYVWDTPDSLA